MARRRTRRNEQGWQLPYTLFKLALGAAVFAATAFYAYEVGQRLALEEVAAARQQIERLTEAETSRRDELARVQTQLDETRRRADEVQALYAKVAPSEDMKELTAALKAKLEGGLDAKRLAFVISQAERPRKCGAEEIKRFMVRTAKFDGASTSVRFSDLITVTAEGVGGNDGAEQWFDPEKPITVHFTALGGKDVQASGKLPLHHALVLKGGEYRFTVSAGARGFIEVTGDRCDYRS